MDESKFPSWLKEWREFQKPSHSTSFQMSLETQTIVKKDIRLMKWLQPKRVLVVLALGLLLLCLGI